MTSGNIRGEADQTIACAVPDVETTDLGGKFNTNGLYQPPGRAVVDFTHYLRQDFADDGGDALGVGDCPVQETLRRYTEFENDEALSEFVNVLVVLLAAVYWEDEHEEVGVAEVMYVLEPLLRD